MGSNNHRGPEFAVQGSEEFHHDLSIVAIQVASGFVGKDDRRIVDQGSSESRPLHFTTGKLRRQVVETGCKIEPGKQFSGLVFDRGICSTRQERGKCDIFEHGERRKQVKGLEDHAYSLPTVLGEFFGRGLPQIAAGNDQLSSGRLIQACQQGQEGTLSGTAVAFQDDEFAPGNMKLDPVDTHHLISPQLVNLGQFPGLDEGLLDVVQLVLASPAKVQAERRRKGRSGASEALSNHLDGLSQSFHQHVYLLFRDDERWGHEDVIAIDAVCTAASRIGYETSFKGFGRHLDIDF